MTAYTHDDWVKHFRDAGFPVEEPADWNKVMADAAANSGLAVETLQTAALAIMDQWPAMSAEQRAALRDRHDIPRYVAALRGVTTFKYRPFQ